MLAYGLAIVADKDDGALPVECVQYFEQACFGFSIKIGVGFVEQEQSGRGYYRPCKHGALQLSSAQTVYWLCGYVCEVHALYGRCNFVLLLGAWKGLPTVVWR